MNRRIADFCKTGSGGTPSRKKLSSYYAGSMPWIKSGELKNKIIMTSEEHITELALKESSAKIIPKGAVLVAMYGATVGQTGILGIDAATNQAICHIIPDSSVCNPIYLVKFLQSKLNVLLGIRVGGAQPNISQNIIKLLNVPLPSLPVQCKVVSVLEKVESAKEKRKEANRLTDEFLKSVFLEMFGDPFLNLKDWKMKKLGEVLDVRDGTHDTPKYINEGIPLITSKNLKDGEIDFENVSYISREDHENIIKRSYVENGDILYGMIGTIGSPVIVNTEREFSIKNVALFKFKERNISNCYIATLMKDDLLTGKLLVEKRGGTQKFVSLDILRNFRIPMPPLELQQKFAKLVQKVEKLKEAQRKSEKELDNLFNLLMQKAFRGDLT